MCTGKVGAKEVLPKKRVEEQETPTNGKEEEEDMLPGLAASAQVV